jgi:hypothetical protein
MKRPGLALALAAIVLQGGCMTMDDDSAVAAGEAEAASKAAEAASAAPPLEPVRATDVRDQAALERLRGNAGLTLQWIGWDKRGTLEVSQRGAVVHLSGSQASSDGKGRLEIEGDVVSIDSNSFILRGQIRIVGTPDAGRSCTKENDSEFAITQGRKYWRMREFEWCDQLTDYIDIYF